MKAKSDRRTNAYTVRYTDEEAKLVEQAAEHLSLEVASLVRMLSVWASRKMMAQVRSTPEESYVGEIIESAAKEARERKK